MQRKLIVLLIIHMNYFHNEVLIHLRYSLPGRGLLLKDKESHFAALLQKQFVQLDILT